MPKFMHEISVIVKADSEEQADAHIQHILIDLLRDKWIENFKIIRTERVKHIEEE